VSVERPEERPRRRATDRMPRLMILRDRAVYRYVDLVRPQLSIGRGPQNDIVLDDPEKLVSRFHAEIRVENGDYVLVDLNSQNGTWLDDRQVDRIVLERGVPVAIGPYQLVLEEKPEGR
jgi:pSer/pThr/pTyr-binding forkhead associated (FHA) protein